MRMSFAVPACAAAPETEPPTLMEAIRDRRSVRRYRDRPVAGETIVELLQAACRAPSPHNRQPWRFAILTKEYRKRALAEAMGDRLRRDRRADGDAETSIETDVARSRQRLTSAPALIVGCMSLVDMDGYPDPMRQDAERTMAAQAVAAAVQTLMLAASARGLGSCWMCAPLFCPDVVREVLNLPPDWEPQALVTLGYPDGSGAPPRDRRPLHDFVHWT